MKKFFAAIAMAFALSLMGTTPAFAETKLGTVDFNRAMNEVDEGKSALDNLEQAMAPKRKELEERQKELAAMAEELKRQSVVLAADAKAAKEREYQTKAAEFQTLGQQYEQELAMMFNQVNEELRLKMQGVLGEIAKTKGVDLVIEKSLVMYQVEGLDLTDDLIKAYNSATGASK